MALSLRLMRTKTQMIDKAKRAIEQGTVFTYLSSHMLGVPVERLHRFTVQGFQSNGLQPIIYLRNCATGEEFTKYLKEFCSRYTEVSA